MTKVLYLSAYQYSGSTLTSFLLNTHPEVATIGHTGGWPFGADEEFFCSCGARIQACPFYLRVRDAFAENGLPFDFRNFGTTFRASSSERLNRYLTAALPKLESRALERLRDSLVHLWPPTARALRQQLRANEVLIETALAHHGARVFVDNSLSPYRVPLLNRSSRLEVMNLHLVRDPHGVANSCRRHHGWSPQQSVKLWLRHQRDIVRIGAEVSNLVTHYDDVCADTNAELGRIFAFAGLPPHDFGGDFKDTEHHILGNQMRLGGGKVKLDTRWREDLGADDIAAIQETLRSALRDPGNAIIRELLERYLH